MSSVLISKKCPFCGRSYQRTFPTEGYRAWENGALIQDALPNMTRLEQMQAEFTVHNLPRIADALESIAKSLEALRGNQSDQPKPRDDYGKAGD